jgi:hypothetical protein
VSDNITDDSQRWEEWRSDSQLYVVDKGVVDRASMRPASRRGDGKPHHRTSSSTPR